jgi:hypothetical protein
MKKAAIYLLFAALLVNLAIFPSYAYDPLPTDVPYAQTPPVIDGNFNADEWQGAWHFHLDAQDPPFITTASSLADDYYPTYDFYTMWDEENFYFAVVCKGDITPTPKKMESGMDTRDNSIRGDGIQLFINPSGDYGETAGKDADSSTYGAACIWTDFYCEYADGVKPFTWAYDPFDGDSIDAMPAVYDGFVIGGARNGDTWTIEVMAPWLVLNGTAAGGHDQWNMSYPRKAGDKVIYNFNTLDYEGDNGGQVRYGITEGGARTDGNLDNWQQFTLVSALAGIAPAPEAVEEPEAAPTEAPAAPAPAPAEPAPAPVAPVTGDGAAVFALVILACAAAFALACKKAKAR